MIASEWSRRRFLQGVGSTVAVGAARPIDAIAQSGGAAEKVVTTCVTTTKDASWQEQPLAKPGWRWDALNLNTDVGATAQTMEGFGGCFNELGWTSLRKLSDG